MTGGTRFQARLPALPMLVLVTGPTVLAIPVLLAFSGGRALLDAFAVPGYAASVGVALFSATLGTLLASLMAAGLLVGLSIKRVRWLSLAMPPLLATPHAAMAVGLAFLLAPSGWLMRVLSPWATGLEQPSLFSVLQDPFGLSLALGLALKELPFIVLLALSAGRREALHPLYQAALSLGYAPHTAFLKAVLPPLLKIMALPVTIAFVYGVSAVDMASVLGPTTPPPLSVLALKTLSDPNPDTWRLGVALSLHLAAYTALAILAAAVFIRRTRPRASAWASDGRRWTGSGAVLSVGGQLGRGALILSALAFFALLLWAFAQRWRFPDALPSAWVGPAWVWARGLASSVSLTTLWLALLSAGLGLALALGFVLAERRAREVRSIWLISGIAPLLLPQMTLVPALLLLDLKLMGMPPAVLALWGHVLFTASYSYLTLRGPVLALGSDYRQAAQSLGRSPLESLWLVELPVLLRPIMASLAIALAVSVAAYLPTLTLGQGRIETFTVEAVAAATGGSRRSAAQFALAQTFWALLFFFAALAVPALLYRHRRGLSVDAR